MTRGLPLQPAGPVDGWRVLLLVLAIAVGVVGMHQLSAGHTLVAPGGPGHAAVAGHHPDSTAAHLHTGPGATPVDALSIVPAAAGPAPMTSDGADPCLGCGQHALLMVCLLALVVAAGLVADRRPASRRWRPVWPPTAQAASPGGAWRRLSLSLAELSISRT